MLITKVEKRIMKILKDKEAHSLKYIAAMVDIPDIQAYCILTKLMTMHYVERDMFEPYYQGSEDFYYRLFGTQNPNWVIRYPLFKRYRKHLFYGLYYTLFYNDKIIC